MVPSMRTVIPVTLISVIAVGWLRSQSHSTHAAAPPAGVPDVTEPVEPDMHEFMEYVFQPTFRRLKESMAGTPADNQAWKSIKADSLILAEGGNLLLMRPADDDAADWVHHSVEVRSEGGQLYRAAKSKNEKLARTHYESMVQNCNACHEQFAGGEHILTP